MEKVKLFIMVGVSGSGKSTKARELSENGGFKVVETDSIRKELTGNESDQSQNGKVFFVAKQRVRDHLRENRNVIFDATNLSIKDRREFVDIGKEFSAEIHAHVVKPALSVSISRNLLRDRKVPVEIIEKQNNKFKMPDESEGFYKIHVY